MTGKVIVHVGLPKTATTTLQVHVFPYAENVWYVGAWHPRSRYSRRDPYASWINAVNGKTAKTRMVTRAKTRKLVEQSLSCGLDVVFSDEMLMHPSGLGREQKLGNLRELLVELDYTVFCTFRDPVKGSFSYFVEKFPHFHKHGISYEEAVEEDPLLEIFDYDYVLRLLFQLFPENRIKALIYDDLVSGSGSIAASYFGLRLKQDVSKLLAKENEKKKTPYYTQSSNELTLSCAVGRSLAWLDNYIWGAKLKSVLGPLDGPLRRIKLRTIKHDVPIPTEQTKRWVTEKYATGWRQVRELAERFP